MQLLCSLFCPSLAIHFGQVTPLSDPPPPPLKMMESD